MTNLALQGQTIKKPKSNDIMAVIGKGGFVQYATNDEHEKAKQLSGRVVSIKPQSKSRNLGFHKKFFALIRLGFQYWSPDISLVSAPESAIAHAVAKRFCMLGGNPELYEVQGKEIADLLLLELKERRSKVLDIESYKCEETYRKEVMVEAGFYELVHMPSGGVIKVPWSIAFDALTDEDFAQIYKGCHDVIWNKSLFQVFDDQREMEAAVRQLMTFI
ncbi:DUF1367 family protein [Vibrio harveyi]